jgi:hypothetical protein
MTTLRACESIAKVPGICRKRRPKVPRKCRESGRKCPESVHNHFHRKCRKCVSIGHAFAFGFPALLKGKESDVILLSSQASASREAPPLKGKKSHRILHTQEIRR